jgi:hypothetical protein
MHTRETLQRLARPDNPAPKAAAAASPEAIVRYLIGAQTCWRNWRASARSAHELTKTKCAARTRAAAQGRFVLRTMNKRLAFASDRAASC